MSGIFAISKKSAAPKAPDAKFFFSTRKTSGPAASLLRRKTAGFWCCIGLLVLAFCPRCFAFAKENGGGGRSEQLDKAKYITVDEIRPGMEAYCLTAYKGTEIEKFGLEVLDVVHNITLDRDTILVQGTDERFIHTGPVAGCSGSPVYIDGRLAGALAIGWIYSKDPVYGATPIEEMLKVSEPSSRPTVELSGRPMGFVFDFSRPIDFAEIDKQITTPRLSRQRSLGGATVLPCPLIISGLPDEVCEQLGVLVEPFGLMVVSGIGGGSSSFESQKTGQGSGDPELVRGACLVVPLVTGDIVMEVVGTVTDVVSDGDGRGDKVYGFGHSFLGYGPVDLPMATGQVHTVVSTMVRSFKLASAVEIVGALRTDESAAVCGLIGAKAKMIPLTIGVDGYGEGARKVFNCQVANNQVLTPGLVRSVVAGAALGFGDLPPEHTIKYKVAISVEGAEPITFENISTNMGLTEMLTESTGPVTILMNNPYKKVDIESISVDVSIEPENIESQLWSVDLSDSKVKAGQTIEIEVVVESFLAEKRKYQCTLKIPSEVPPGKYDLIVCGGNGYLDFLKKTVPYRFVPQNLATLLEATNSLLQIPRDRLYCLLVLPSGGVAIERAELPDLPATKSLVLQDAKRVLKMQPYRHWLEKSLRTGSVIMDKKVISVTVEK